MCPPSAYSWGWRWHTTAFINQGVPMKPHRILKSFPGAQDGNHTETFEAGTTRHLSAALAAVVVPEGWAEPHDEAEKVEHAASPAEDRDTKVVTPDETKEEAQASPNKRNKK